MTTDAAACIGLDPAWIGDRLTDGDRRPASVRFDGFIGTGQMSRNARFSLDWADGRGPASVVVKLPSGDEATRTVSFEHGVYRRECEFYRSIAPLVDVAVPAALAVHYDHDARDFAIVLEDLAGSVQGDQFAEPTDDQLLVAVEQAAALHGPVWGDTSGPAFAPYREDVEERAAATGERMSGLLPLVMERLGPALEAETVAMLERFAPLAATWVRLRSVPTTLVHGDFRPDNFLFAVEAGAPPLVVVDWQTLALGLGVTDVAYLLGGAVAPDRRRRIEDDMIAAYREQLARRGVDYPLDRCRADYALGSLHGVMIAVAATAMAARTERGDALFALMLNRHGRHALDLGVLDRIEAAR